jgi:uncharacterized membrane protein
MYTRNVLIFVVLSAAMLTAFTTAATSLTAPAYANDEKKCKNNDDNNCNDTHKTQKIKTKNECEIENTNKDHSSDNTNENELICVNEAQNLKDVVQESVFGDGGTTEATADEASADENQTLAE